MNGNQGSDTKLLAELKQDQITNIVFQRAEPSQVKIVMYQRRTPREDAGGEKTRDRREDAHRRGARCARQGTEAEPDKRRVRALHPLEELVAQQIISCDKTDEGCNGRDLPTASERAEHSR